MEYPAVFTWPKRNLPSCQALNLRAVKAGVSLFEPTNVYVLNDRSLKYALDINFDRIPDSIYH